MAITSVPSRSSIGNYDVTGLVAERPQHRWLATQLNTTAVQHTYIHVTHQDISQFHNNSTNNQQVKKILEQNRFWSSRPDDSLVMSTFKRAVRSRDRVLAERYEMLSSVELVALITGSRSRITCTMRLLHSPWYARQRTVVHWSRQPSWSTADWRTSSACQTHTKLDKKMVCYCRESTILPGRGMPSNAWLSTSPDSRCCPQPNLTLS